MRIIIFRALFKTLLAWLMTSEASNRYWTSGRATAFFMYRGNVKALT
jgi:hypothetical protein